ncbi:hypothetical protein EDB80DRAFT_709112 [Ilyonectria destructans]|nr:hypothetical protein EDB80DRAFT_709112 [Ilyonectria destructans]
MPASRKHRRPIDVGEAGDHPTIHSYSAIPLFRVADRVYLLENGARQGPYLVAAVSAGKFQLCHENGAAVQGRTLFPASSLVKA